MADEQVRATTMSWAPRLGVIGRRFSFRLSWGVLFRRSHTTHDWLKGSEGFENCRKTLREALGSHIRLILSVKSEGFEGFLELFLHEKGNGEKRYKTPKPFSLLYQYNRNVASGSHPKGFYKL